MATLGVFLWSMRSIEQLLMECRTYNFLRFRQDVMPGLQEEMFRRGAQGAGQILSHAVLQVQGLRQFFGSGRVLFQGRFLLLHRGLPEAFRHEMRFLPGLRRRRG